MKNRSIYKFYSVNDFAMDALQQGYIYCNHYTAFNDPFECWCEVKSGVPNHETETERFLNIIEVWGFTPDRAAEALEYYYFYLEHFEEDQMDVQYQLDAARIACFSSDVSSLLMWSHYADGLRGFCLELDPDLLCADSKANIIEVQYLARPPVLETIAYELANDISWHGEDEDADKALDYMRDFYCKMLASKPREWKYEKEVRLIFPGNEVPPAGTRYYYPPAAIRSLITGEKISAQNEEKLKKIIQAVNPAAATGRPSRNFGSYELSISRN